MIAPTRILVNRYFFKFIFNWPIIALHYCVGFCLMPTWISLKHTYVPSLLNLPPTSRPSHPSRLLQSPGMSSLSHRANSHWLSISHAVVYMFPCYSLRSSHPLLTPPPPVSVSLFSMSVSSLLPCKIGSSGSFEKHFQSKLIKLVYRSGEFGSNWGTRRCWVQLFRYSISKTG